MTAPAVHEVPAEMELPAQPRASFRAPVLPAEPSPASSHHHPMLARLARRGRFLPGHQRELLRVPKDTGQERCVALEVQPPGEVVLRQAAARRAQQLQRLHGDCLGGGHPAPRPRGAAGSEALPVDPLLQLQEPPAPACLASARPPPFLSPWCAGGNETESGARRDDLPIVCGFRALLQARADSETRPIVLAC